MATLELMFGMSATVQSRFIVKQSGEAAAVEGRGQAGDVQRMRVFEDECANGVALVQLSLWLIGRGRELWAEHLANQEPRHGCHAR